MINSKRGKMRQSYNVKGKKGQAEEEWRVYYKKVVIQIRIIINRLITPVP